MSLAERIEVLDKLGQSISRDNPVLSEAITKARLQNPWFTDANSWIALDNIREHFLQKEILEQWTSSYDFSSHDPKRVGLILAGNIPLVGFHDILSVFLSGHIAKIKYSEKDNILIPTILNSLFDIDKDLVQQFERVERLKDFDAVIATGSNNSARYFDYYFSAYPHIIRKHRNAIAVLDGKETEEQLDNLAQDVFQYFGLGCRNVSKIYVPKDYQFDKLLENFHKQNEIILHHKYKNNFDYNIALFLLNKENYLNNGSIILREDNNLTSRIACLNYERYHSRDHLVQLLNERKDEIQCIVSGDAIDGIETFDFGQAQKPSIDDYADGVDTLKFLSQLS